MRSPNRVASRRASVPGSGGDRRRSNAIRAVSRDRRLTRPARICGHASPGEPSPDKEEVPGSSPGSPTRPNPQHTRGLGLRRSPEAARRTGAGLAPVRDRLTSRHCEDRPDPDITEVRVASHGVLWLTFSEGGEGEVAVLDRMRGPVFADARTPEGFARHPSKPGLVTTPASR